MYVFIFWRNEVKAANNIKVSEKKGIGSTLIEKKKPATMFYIYYMVDSKNMQKKTTDKIYSKIARTFLH